jgi:uncharacterized membrane protein (UPF0136 family)
VRQPASLPHESESAASSGQASGALLKGVATCHDRGMAVGSSDTSARQSSGRGRTVGWVLGLVLALALGVVVVVRAVVMRQPPPLASRPLQIRTLDHPLIMDNGGDPQNRFDPPRRGEHAGISAATIFHTWLKNTEGSIYDRAIPSSKPIPVTLARWSQWHGLRAVSPKRLTWLFQLIGVPCVDVGFLPPGQTTPPPDRDGCDEYLMFDAQSGAGGGGFVTRSGAAVLRLP